MFSFSRNQSQTINIPNIGPVLLEKSKRAKHINISVKPPAKIRVAVPRGISYKKAASFASTKVNWIKKTLHKMSLRQENSVKLQPVNRNEAKLYLLNRLDELARTHGFTYNNATIRNQKTRWGSCSGQNNISLNMQLMNLPKQLIDYVILHELVHTLVKNHSPLFWSTLLQFVPDSKLQNKRLKKYILN